jgi:branched-chain amino acid transport system substrate-binding protein
VSGRARPGDARLGEIMGPRRAPSLLWAAAAAALAACARDPPPRPAPVPSVVEPQVVVPSGAPPAGSISIAAVFPTVGRYALSGVQSMNGARLAARDLNAAGGVRGRPVALLEYRTGSFFLDARQAARLAAEAGALAVVGSNASELSMAIAQEAEERGVVQVSNVSTAQDLTWDPASGQDRRFVFRVCSTDVVMGALLAAFAREELGARRAAVLYEVGRPYSARLARSFLGRFRDAPAGHTAAEFSYLTLETDFRAQLRAVQAFAPEVLFVPGSFTDATLVAQQAKELGLEATLLGADAWSSPLLFKRGGPARRAFFVDHCSPPAGFAERYLREFGQESQGCRAALAYDAVRTVAAAAAALGPLGDGDLAAALPETRRRLRDAVAAADLSGLTGRVRFDERGDRRTGVAVLEAVPQPEGPPVVRLHGWAGER